MNIVIVTDMEGIAGLDLWEMSKPSIPEEYAKGVVCLEADTNAAVKGFFDGGADNVYVVDGHMSGHNMNPERIDKRAKVIRLEWQDLLKEGKIDACALVGMHAMAGAENAFIDHTQSEARWFDYSINGISCGELVQLAAFAGAFGVPVIMASGDVAAEKEFRKFIGDKALFATVKKAIKRNVAITEDVDRSRESIYECAKNSIALIKDIKPYKVNLPAEVRVVFQRPDYCDDAAERYERIDSRTVRKSVEKIESYFSLLL